MTRQQPTPEPAPGLADIPAWSTAALDPATIAAAQADGTCPRCGRDVGDASCRPSGGGWYCLADGLIGFGTVFRDPTADWTPAQRQTHDAYAAALTEAEQRVDAAMEAHAAAQAAHYRALLRLQQLGTSTETGGLLIRPHGAGPVQSDHPPRRDATWAATVADAEADADDTGNALRDAEAELTRARPAYYTLAAQRDAAMARAGYTGKPGKPRATTTLGRIRDRILT